MRSPDPVRAHARNMRIAHVVSYRESGFIRSADEGFVIAGIYGEINEPLGASPGF